MSATTDIAPSIEGRLLISMLDRWGLRAPTPSELLDLTSRVADALAPINRLAINLRKARDAFDNDGVQVPMSTEEFGAAALAAKTLTRTAEDLREWATTIEDVAEDLALEDVAEGLALESPAKKATEGEGQAS